MPSGTAWLVKSTRVSPEPRSTWSDPAGPCGLDETNALPGAVLMLEVVSHEPGFSVTVRFPAATWNGSLHELFWTVTVPMPDTL